MSYVWSELSSIDKRRVEDNLPRVAWHHWILHQESLVVKCLKMPHVTKVVITTVNWIRANALNHRKFKKFLSNIDADDGDVVVFTAVRWLSRAAGLKKFYDLRSEIEMFAEGKASLSLATQALVVGLASMIDITNHFPSLNCIPQGNSKFVKICKALRLSSLKTLSLENAVSKWCYHTFFDTFKSTR